MTESEVFAHEAEARARAADRALEAQLTRRWPIRSTTLGLASRLARQASRFKALAEELTA